MTDQDDFFRTSFSGAEGGWARDTLVDPPDDVVESASTDEYKRATDSALIRLADARVGTKVADVYQLLRVVGRGALGTVYEARNTRAGDLVALKLLHPPFRHSKLHEGRFIWDVRTAAAIRHPNVIRVLEAGRDLDHALYQVLELLHGETLADLFGRGPLLIDDALKVARELLAALDAVHVCGFVHRAVRPGTVFLSCQPGNVRIKLMDFGLARRIGSREELPWATVDDALQADPTYVAPELLSGEAEADSRSDVWSAGAVLFHALAGRPPFKDDRLYVLLKRIVENQAPPLASFRPDLPQGIQAVVDRALMREPQRRWTTPHQMAAALASGGV